MKINIKEFLSMFNSMYELLYNANVSGVATPGAAAAMDYADAWMEKKENKPLLYAITDERRDFFVSDREVSAFGLTLQVFGL